LSIQKGGKPHQDQQLDRLSGPVGADTPPGQETNPLKGTDLHE
jgi:hypothetical protein